MTYNHYCVQQMDRYFLIIIYRTEIGLTGYLSDRLQQTTIILYLIEQITVILCFDGLDCNQLSVVYTLIRLFWLANEYFISFLGLL